MRILLDFCVCKSGHDKTRVRPTAKENSHCDVAHERHVEFVSFHIGSLSVSIVNFYTTRLSTAGDRAFPVAVARTWNSLSRSLTSLSSLAVEDGTV